MFELGLHIRFVQWYENGDSVYCLSLLILTRNGLIDAQSEVVTAFVTSQNVRKKRAPSYGRLPIGRFY